MTTKFEAFRTQPESGLNGKLKELTQQNFQARFTSEAMTPAKGAEIKKRRRDIARVQTVLAGRKSLARLQAESKLLEERIKKLGPANRRDADQRYALKSARERLSAVARAIKSLGAMQAK